LLISPAGLLTFHQETQITLSNSPQKICQTLIDTYQLPNSHNLHCYANQDWFAPIASGSSVNEVMIVCPCSMATLAKIAHGISDDLIARAADVTLKERKNLIIIPRETPLSAIHLEHMLQLAKIGVAIIPPIPAFYTLPQSLDDIISFVASRILDQAGIPNNLYKRWQYTDTREN
jgi:4-hydroxy-3-polyprenylbenzoate decarboxylase